MKLHIKKGRIIDPANNIDKEGDIYIADGRIVSVLKTVSGFGADQVIDAKGLWVCPGIIDLGARFREPGLEHKATIESEAVAAAAGGVTAVCYPPDTDPVIDTAAAAELIHQRATATGRVRIHTVAALTQGLEGKLLAEMAGLKEAGCIAVSNVNRAIASTEVFRRSLEYAATVDLPVFIHAEDPWLRNYGVAHEGALSTRLGLPPIPETAETTAVAQALLLIEHAGARAHFCRLSAARSIELVAAARQRGLPVTADVGICHLHLTEMDIDGYNTQCHLIPPLRRLADKEALTQSVADGRIEAVCSDHQPHDLDAKAAPFSLSEPGASTLETLLPLVLDLVHKEKLTPGRAVACLTAEPARILGLDAGTLSKDAPADVILIDPDAAWTVDRERLLSAGRNTPFHGWEMSGRVTHTLLGGRLVHQAV
jgi:dihydroorotase